MLARSGARLGCRALGRQQAGFNLIEVMVAVAVLAIGLLGIAALQIQGVRYNYGSLSRSQAVLTANDFAERLYANRLGARAGNYSGLDSNAVNCATAPAQICARQSNQATPAVCNAAQMATYDRYVVSCGFPTSTGRYGGVRDLLTGGRIQVTCVNAADVAGACAANPFHRILVTWQERVTGANNQTTLQTVNFRMVVQP